MRRTLTLAFAAVALAASVAACGSDPNVDVDVDVEAPPLESPLATEETEVGGGASPTPEASTAP